MARTKSLNSSKSVSKSRPALTPEARENQLIAKAYNEAERQIDEGTASSQVITHFLKLGTQKEKLELERLKQENELLKAKTEAIASGQRQEELYEQALNAMKSYSGNNDD